MKLPSSVEERLPGALKDRKVREDIKDKFELFMAFVVVTGFVIKKIQGPEEDEETEETT